VLAASRDVVEVDYGEGPFMQHEVSMKIALRNAGSHVRDFEMIEWFVGSEMGTNYAYSPHDDWCRGEPSPFESLTDLSMMGQVFPGEVVMGSLCVSVPSTDVADLELYAEAWNHAGAVESATLALPPDGADVASVDGLS